MKKIDQWFQKKFKIENINLLHTWYICFIVIGILIIGLCVRNIVSSPGDMYSFSGAVIGGGLTLIGVMITINEQEEQRRKDLAIQYKPILIISDSFKVEKPTGQLAHKVYINNDRVIYRLKLKNLGRGEASNIKLTALVKNAPSFSITFEENNMSEFDFMVPNDDGMTINLVLTLIKGNDILNALEQNNPNIAVTIEYKCPFEEDDKKTVNCTLTHKYVRGKENKLIIRNDGKL